MKKRLSTKIIAGEFKGKSIFLADMTITRSSKNIIRESVFNALQSEIESSVFVEVFAGSGTIGIEALSRGAEFVYFLEKDRDSYRCIKSNLELLSIQNALVYNVDSFEFFAELLEILEKKEKRIFYFDPPFSIRKNMEDIYDGCTALIASIDPKPLDIVVVEHMTGYELAAKIGSFNRVKTKKFGKSSLAYYTL